MEQKEQQKNYDLLFLDLCSRIPYGNNLKVRIGGNPLPYSLDNRVRFKITYLKSKTIKDILYEHLPYLRTLDSMTEKEKAEYESLEKDWEKTRFLDSHMFDHRGLIEQGLASKAVDGMYKFE